MAGKKNLDKRQLDFLAYYMNPKSPTFTNAYQSAIKAGFAKQYAESITSMELDWLSEAMGNQKMVKKAEKNLDEFLGFGNKDKDKLKIKADISKFVAERLNKNKWSQRQEYTGKDGKEIVIQISKEVANKNNVSNISPKPNSKSDK